MRTQGNDVVSNLSGCHSSRCVHTASKPKQLPLMSSTSPWKPLEIDTGRSIGDAEDSTGNGGPDLRGKVEEIRTTGNPTLTEDHIAFLGRYGRSRKTEAGEILFRVGDTSYEFMVVLEGEVEI